MRAAAFDYHAPSSLDEAVGLLAEHGDDARVLAGGQSLVPAMNSRLARPGHVIDINRIAHAERPHVSAGRLRIPPLMRHVDFDTLAVDGPLGPLMRDVTRHISHLPIRLRGTFCGSVANADPASEWCLATTVLGAEMIARSARRGVRNVLAKAFYESIMTTALADDEMLVEVQIPLLSPFVRYGFHKIARRSGDYGLALCLVVYERDEDEMVKVRVGLGGVEAVPRRLGAVEELLERRQPSRRLFREAADLAAEIADPLVTADGDEAYQRDLTRAVVTRALDRSLEG